MKKTTYFVVCILLLIVGLNMVSGQTLKLSIANQTVVGSTIKFDIMMQATVGTVYLAGADLVLTFDNANFTTPATAKGLASTFTVTNPFYLADPVNNLTSAGGTPAALYRSLATPAAISSNEIIINVNTPTVGDQPTFDSDVAVIDNNPYKFGTYTISGITTATGKFNLAWKTSGGGVVTAVSTFANTTPWNVSLVTLDVSPAIVNTTLPVELTSFTVTANHLSANLNWATATEVNNVGFDVERRAVSDQLSAVSTWQKVGFVNGNGTSNVQHSYSFSDNITISGTYAYRLKQIDNSGTFKYSQETQVAIEIPKVFTLTQNYPNPFNPTTNIDFTVASDGKATLTVYNTLGQEVAVLYNGVAQAGRIIQTHFDASRLASGIYFSRLEADGKSLVKRMMFVK